MVPWPRSLRLFQLASVAVLTVLFAGACADLSPPDAPHLNRSAATADSEAARAFAADRDLCLFGSTDPARDVTFEGKAATDIEQHTAPGEGADFDPDVDPTGKMLVFASTRHSHYSHLYVKSIGGAVITQITDEHANDVQPTFCPLGERIAFASDRGGDWNIWIVDTKGGNPTQITNTPAPELHPSWSPDGKRLVCCRLNEDENGGELWVLDLENPGVKRLIGEGLFPEWSPTGDRIVYQRARERGSRWFSIWTIELRDDEVLYPTEVASSPSAAYISPAWSADGTQIAFTAVSPVRDQVDGQEILRISGAGRSDVVVVDASGRGLQRLTDGRGENYAPSWAIDGRIFFTAKLRSSETIWSIRPFRPPVFDEPTVTTGNRRAAQVGDAEMEP